LEVDRWEKYRRAVCSALWVALARTPGYQRYSG
jgi:hypothetical protein